MWMNLPRKMIVCGLLKNCSVERMMWNVVNWDHEVSDGRCSPWKDCHACVRRAHFWGCASPSKPYGMPLALTAQEWRGGNMSTTWFLGCVVYHMKPHCDFVVFSKMNLSLAVAFTPGRHLGQTYFTKYGIVFMAFKVLREKWPWNAPWHSLCINKTQSEDPSFSSCLWKVRFSYPDISLHTEQHFSFVIVICHVCLISRNYIYILIFSNLPKYIFRLSWWVSSFFSLWCPELNITYACYVHTFSEVHASHLEFF